MEAPAAPLPLSETPARDRRGAWQEMAQTLAGCALIMIAVLGADLAGNVYWRYNVQILGVFLIVSFCQNFLLVDAGQKSFGQGAIFGAAAYAVAILQGMHGVSYPLAAAAGVATALVFGLAFALPALRVQGYYLGFATFGAAIIFPQWIMAFNGWTNGVNGISMSYPSLNAPTALLVSPVSLAVALLACGSLLFHVLIRRTPFGRALRVSAASAEAAQSLGISPGRMRSAAFLIAAAGTGLAGILYPPVVGFVGPSAFSVDLSVLFFFAVIVGGRGQTLGPIVGMIVIYLLPNMLLAQVVNYRLLIYGAIALFAMLAMPDGLVGTVARWLVRRRRTSLAGLDLNVDRVIGPALASAHRRETDGRPVIVVEGGRKVFGKVVALDGVDIAIGGGEIHGIIGANGSGKTSLLNVLSGLSRLDAGRLALRGRDIGRLASHQVGRLGIGRTFQTPRIFEEMTVFENIAIGIDARDLAAPAVPEAFLAELRSRFGDMAVELVSHGQRRLLEVLRVVLTGSDILLLDEPAAGLSERERDEFSTLLRRLRDDAGRTVILVEHDLDLVLDIADRITVLDAGRVIASGTPQAILADPAVKPLFMRTNDA